MTQTGNQSFVFSRDRKMSYHRPYDTTISTNRCLKRVKSCGRVILGLLQDDLPLLVTNGYRNKVPVIECFVGGSVKVGHLATGKGTDSGITDHAGNDIGLLDDLID